MKAGDLVIAPHRLEKFNIEDVGLIFNNEIVRNRIPVLWSNELDKVVYEPINMLEILSEAEFRDER